MSKRIYYYFFILFSFIFVSCNRNESPIEKSEEIPSDSFYLSFKMNGERLVFQSPSAAINGSGRFIQRLHKLNNSLKDSTIIGYHYDYIAGNYNISIGFSKCVLIDTTVVSSFSYPDSKKQIFATGEVSSQFMPSRLQVKSATSKYTGFYITILDPKTHIQYKSYLDNSSEYDNLTQYNYFRANSSYKILKSTELYPKVGSDYISTWFHESAFNCVLYDYDSNTSKFSTILLTDGILRGSF